MPFLEDTEEFLILWHCSWADYIIMLVTFVGFLNLEELLCREGVDLKLKNRQSNLNFTLKHIALQ